MSIEQRKHHRQTREEKIFIEVLSASDNGADDNVMLECTTRDISESGLKIQSQYPFIISSILELLINFESGGYKFLLTGEVKWFEEVPGGEYLAGFELIDAEHSDFLVWQNMFTASAES
ncbi:PilZ domain-containing protein [Aliikangiella coralliicola]|uniref:PilZ domain-containing protein n=1 Tax=Aliikangiella coralliicola TaxID=2592383 RepID=A0A545U4T3_9GAMM|nr:PilZ domain-containing protein [Aliikangiella coralliicola]TQV84479.1 PilZ domain-containing protein [Aliikangiella coralliicola]